MENRNGLARATDPKQKIITLDVGRVFLDLALCAVSELMAHTFKSFVVAPRRRPRARAPPDGMVLIKRLARSPHREREMCVKCEFV